MIIKDGTGTGNTAGVDSRGRLNVDAITRPLSQRNNEVFKKSFSLPFDGIDPVGADDYFVYINNTGTKDLHITNIRVRSTVAGTVELHAVTGTASFAAGTDITPVNKSVGDSATINSTIKTDTNTTGLTTAGTLYYVRCAVANTDYNLNSESHVIIPPGKSVALLWDTSTGILSGVISLYEDQGLI